MRTGRWMVKFSIITMVLSVSIIYTGAINAQKRVVTFNSFHSDLVPRRVMTEVVKLFEQKHPDIRVDMSTTAHEDFKNAIRLWLTSNAPPDVFTWFAGERAKFFVDNRLIMDITDLWQDNKYDTLFPRAFKSLSVFNGKASFIPQSWHWWGIWYRKSIFSQYGVIAPRTWNEFLNVCEKFKGNGITPITIGTKYRWPAAGWFDYLNLRVNGRDFHMGLMAGEEKYTDPRLHKVFQIWKELIDKKYFLEDAAAYSWQEAVLFLLNGKAAMYLMGKFITDVIPEETQDDIDFFQFPIIDPFVPIVEDAPMDGFMASNKALHPETARIFMDFQTSREAQELFNLKSGRVAANMQIPGELYPPIARKGIEMIKKADSVTQFYDRDTTPPMADRGLNAFVEFMARPQTYKQILTRLDAVRKEIFKK